MKKKYLDRWTKALRSGSHVQTSSTLVSTDLSGDKSYCCLGVLSDVCLTPKDHEKIHADTGWKWDGEVWRRMQGESESGFLPTDVMAWLGVSKEIENAAQERLSNMNDGLGSYTRARKFPFIAKMIESMAARGKI